MKIKILLVDDEYDIIFPLDLALTSEGYRVFTAFNGRDALEDIQQGLLPDLIITDIMMPHMDGIDFISKLRLSNETNKIPIIVMSAGPNPYLQNYTISYLRKPFDLERFMKTVAELAGKPMADASNENHESETHMTKILGNRPK